MLVTALIHLSVQSGVLPAMYNLQATVPALPADV